MGISVVYRPAKLALKYKIIQQEIAKQVGNVGRLHVQERDKVVADFDTSIKFGYEAKITPGQVTLNINVKNSSDQVSEGFTVGDLWKALDKTGTRGPYPIPKNPQPGKRLAFRIGYQPHTRPIGRSGGPGVATGKLVRPVQVQHPGIKPRKFSQGINKRLRPALSKAISRGISLGWKRIGK